MLVSFMLFRRDGEEKFVWFENVDFFFIACILFLHVLEEIVFFCLEFSGFLIVGNLPSRLLVLDEIVQVV
jgi:hypothetical protein